MVKVLSTGEIVQDDDPRTQGSRNKGGNSERPRQGFVQHDENPEQQGMYQGGQTVSIFDSLNERLLAAGLPRWNAGPYTIEPIVSVGFLLAGLLMGVQGLLFAAILFAVCKFSTGRGGGGGLAGWFGGGARQGPGRNSRGGSGRPPRGGGGSGGQRLGRS